MTIGTNIKTHQMTIMLVEHTVKSIKIYRARWKNFGDLFPSSFRPMIFFCWSKTFIQGLILAGKRRSTIWFPFPLKAIFFLKNYLPWFISKNNSNWTMSFMFLLVQLTALDQKIILQGVIMITIFDKCVLVRLLHDTSVLQLAPGRLSEPQCYLIILKYISVEEFITHLVDLNIRYIFNLKSYTLYIRSIIQVSINSTFQYY